MSGWLLVLAAGLCQGGFMAPMKFTRGWKWENSWFVFAATAYLLCPWLFVALTAGNPAAIYQEAGASRVLTVMAMGLLWGLGALTFGLGVDALGLSIGFAVILGVAAISGTLVPLLFLGAAPPPAGALGLTMGALALMLAGVTVCSLAGRWKETAGGGSSGYLRGVALCVLSGVLSSCGNIGFVLGQPIISLARERGVSPDFAPNLVWALLTISLFLCNAGFTGVQLVRNGTLGLFAGPALARNLALGVTMGVLWMLGFVLYGVGAGKLGEWGSSLGWSVLMGSMVMAANLLGILTGEWRQAPPGALRQLWWGVSLLCLAVVAIGLANRMAA